MDPTQIFAVLSQGGSFAVLVFLIVWAITKGYPSYQKTIEDTNNKWAAVVKDLQAECKAERKEIWDNLLMKFGEHLRR